MAREFTPEAGLFEAENLRALNLIQDKRLASQAAAARRYHVTLDAHIRC